MMTREMTSVKAAEAAPELQQLNAPEVFAQQLSDDGNFPNSKLPLLIYHNAIPATAPDMAAFFEQLYAAHGWGGIWRNGIYAYHHYHSTAHEVLGVYRGSAKLQLGGPRGIIQKIQPGDVLIIPAGVAHKNLAPSPGFGVVAAYPQGQEWDMNYGGTGERPHVDDNIARVPLPNTDPIYGASGPLLEKWGTP